MSDVPEKVRLKPCPFCGGSAETVVLEDEDGRFAAVSCPTCGAGSRQHYFCGEDAREFAADAWNRRAALHQDMAAQSQPSGVGPSDLTTGLDAEGSAPPDLREVVEDLLFWIAQGDFSRLPMGAIERMNVSRVRARAALAKAAPADASRSEVTASEGEVSPGTNS